MRLGLSKRQCWTAKGPQIAAYLLHGISSRCRGACGPMRPGLQLLMVAWSSNRGAGNVAEQVMDHNVPVLQQSLKTHSRQRSPLAP